jgi:hypothetical protein
MVTLRDRRVVKKVAAARWLSTFQIAELCFHGLSPEMARRRIRLLRAERYLRSVRANAMAETMHTLGTRGREYLGREGTAPIRVERTLPRNLAHFTGINDLRVAVERSAIVHGITVHFFFASWELQANGWRLPLVPDAVCRVEYGTRSVTALFEYDRGRERPSYLLQTKFTQYCKGLPGFPFSRVIIVAETAHLRDRLQAYLGNRLQNALFSFIAKDTLMHSWSVGELLS